MRSPSIGPYHQRKADNPSSSYVPTMAAAAMAAAAVACARGFGAVNPVAGDLAKPAVAWAVILAVVNYKML